MTPRNKSSVWQALFSDIDISMLVYFRIVYGLTIFAWATKTLLSGAVEEFYVAPRLHFTYSGFHWIEPLPGEGMRFLFLLLACGGLVVILGICYRFVSLVVAFGFTYVFFLDKVCYQNHYYLICLISWIMVVAPAHRGISFDVRWRPKLRADRVPAWTLGLLRFQIAVPYFYGGVAKLSSDWLQGQPMRDALAERASMPLVGGLLSQEWVLWLVCYGGLLFDLLVVPALLWKRTRTWAFALALMFHLTNATLFQIGVFPWFMILATVIFFPPGFPRQLIQSLFRRKVAAYEPIASEVSWVQMSLLRKSGFLLLGVFVLLQIVLPLRHLAYVGNVNWTEAGHRFAWHMMLRGKRCGIRYYVVDPDTAKALPIDLRPFLSEFQVTRFGRDPMMIEQLARYLGKDLRENGFSERVEIRVMALVSLNGRKPQLMIDPLVDLASQPTTSWWQSWWWTPIWVLPLVEPLRQTGWDVPLEEWERHVDVPVFMQAGR